MKLNSSKAKNTTSNNITFQAHLANPYQIKSSAFGLGLLLGDRLEFD